MIFGALETERLLVRPFQPEDVAALAAIYGDTETMRFVGGCRTEAQVILPDLAAGHGRYGDQVMPIIR